MRVDPEELLRSYYQELLGKDSLKSATGLSGKYLSFAAAVFSSILLVLALWRAGASPSVPARSIAHTLHYGEIIEYFAVPLEAVGENGFGGKK